MSQLASEHRYVRFDGHGFRPLHSLCAFHVLCLNVPHDWVLYVM